MDILKVFTAFSGYDSQCMALDRLGIEYELVGWSEVDRYAIIAHDAVYPQWKDRNFGDISKIDWIEVPDFDLFTYSFPCTNLSFAGKQEGFDEGSGTASSLLWECRKAIVEKKPKYLLMENVKALVSAKFKPLFMKWQNELASYGYTNFVKVLDSQHFGVPQHRERVFMVSILDGNASFHFPEPFPLDKKLKDVLKSNVDEKYYLKDNQIKYIFSTSMNGIKRQGVSDIESPAPTVVSSCYKGNNMICINAIGNLYGGNKQAGRIYDAEDISLTLDNMASGGNKSPKIIEPKLLGYSRDNIGKVVKRTFKDVCNTIHTSTGHGGNTDCLVYEPQILTPKRNEYGKAVRKEYESGLFDESRHNMTYLAPREDGVSNTITSVPKDNLLCEPRANNISYKITKDGKIRAYQNDDKKSGVSEFQIDNEESVASIVTTAHAPKCYGESMGFRIRKLTPRECFRLQDVDDEDIDKLLNSGISNTQLYKMAGNSITVAPLYHIFRKLFIEKDNENQQLTLF